MKKIILLIIPLVVAVLAGIALFTINFNRPPDWQADLERYLAYKNAGSLEPYQVVSMRKAGMPWNLTLGMSDVSFGESVHYQTDIDYSMEIPDQETEPVLPEDASSGSLIPLPFPPEEVWCIYLEREDQLRDIVLVALHQDLYNADYIIHEIAITSQTNLPSEIMVIIGCALP